MESMASAGPVGAVQRLEYAIRRLAQQTQGRARTGRSHQDADDAAGTVASDDAIGFDPLPLLRALDEHGTHVVVIGQVAGIMHGSRELTGDLDLLWDGDQGQAAALAAAFTSASAVLADKDGAPVRCQPDAFALPKVLFHSASASGDCCTPALPWGSLPVADFIATRGRGRTSGWAKPQGPSPVTAPYSPDQAVQAAGRCWIRRRKSRREPVSA
jgi:hypothetical protein